MIIKIRFPLFFVVVLLIMICSCSGKTKRSRKPVTAVEIVPALKNYTFGQSVTLNITTKIKNGTLKKVDVYLNNRLLTTSTQSQFQQTINFLNELGNNTLRINAEKTDGVSNSRTIPITVLSDISPLKYDYTVIRDYPHSTEHFTQGLQLHEGFLYEGTGENGKSNLYKINLSNNVVIQKTALPEQYFGEGITLLKDKIYQLTYRHKTGFIYNLSDFTLIDSFKFVSDEGWGLTNDGKSLIMSDGTGTLTWVNPDDFSIDKRIQVADNVKVFQYLNELEYDNGYIWANIWTTEQIIRIEANTGKVAGYFDVSGILSIMNSNPSQRIDVLNGIAVFPKSGHLLITGKLWPKLFEIKINTSKKSGGVP